MARIRSIKPEFWTSEQVLQCSRDARLLFIGIWTFCDDAGRHTYSPITLKAEIFPGDDITGADVQGWLAELIASGLLLKYEVAGKNYIAVTGWHHQKIDRPQPAKHPPPPSEPGPVDDGSSNIRRPFDDHSTNTRRAFATESSRVESKGEESSSVSLAREPLDTPVLSKGDDDDVLISKVKGALGGTASELVVRKGLGHVRGWLSGGFDLELDVLPELREIGSNLTKPMKTLTAPRWGDQIAKRRDARLAAPAARAAPTAKLADVWVQRGTPAWKAWEAHEGKELVAVETKYRVGEWGRYFPSRLPNGAAPSPQSAVASPSSPPPPSPRRFVDMSGMLARADVTRQIGSPS